MLFMADGDMCHGIKLSLLQQKEEEESILTLKTASTEKIFLYGVSREKVENFENRIRISLALALLDIFFPKVV